ncbi:NADPH-dependent F420 reductase [bacterium]|nr:NADPH-dependent F420 reductase [bacterium]
MKIAIIGAGNVGKTLGTAWEKKGQSVLYGVRNPKPGTTELEVTAAVTASDVIILAVPWSAMPSVLENKALFRGKVVVDCTNPINSDFTGLTLGNTDSGGETVARMIPEAKVVKAFNSCGFNVMANPEFPTGKATMFVAGDDKAAKETTLELAQSIGFEAIDAGPLVQSRYLEATAWLWISMAMKYGLGREIAFSLLRR